eukprot:gene5149-7169_t
MLFQHFPEEIASIVLIYLVGNRRSELITISNLLSTNKYFSSITCKILNAILNDYFQESIYLKNLYDYQGCCHSKLRIYSLLSRQKIFTIGGNYDTRRCDSLDLVSNKFEKVCSLDFKRFDGFDAVCHQGVIFVISGLNNSSNGIVEIYNIFQNKWIKLHSIPDSSTYSSAVSSGVDLYVIGGVESNQMRSSAVYKLKRFSLPGNNVSTVRVRADRAWSSDSAHSNDDRISHSLDENDDNCWSLCDHRLLIGRSHHSSIAFKGNIWIAGGFIGTTRLLATSTVEIFDMQNSVWSKGPQMVHCRLCPKLVVMEDVLYAVGGDMFENLRISRPTIERFNEASNSWEIVTEYPCSRYNAAIVGSNTEIFTFGGMSLVDWDKFDVKANTWASQLLTSEKSEIMGQIPGRNKVLCCAKSIFFKL